MKILHTMKKGYKFTNHLEGLYFDEGNMRFYTDRKSFPYKVKKDGVKYIYFNRKMVYRNELQENCKPIRDVKIQTYANLPF